MLEGRVPRPPGWRTEGADDTGICMAFFAGGSVGGGGAAPLTLSSYIGGGTDDVVCLWLSVPLPLHHRHHRYLRPTQPVNPTRINPGIYGCSKCRYPQLINQLRCRVSLIDVPAPDKTMQQPMQREFGETYNTSVVLLSFKTIPQMEGTVSPRRGTEGGQVVQRRSVHAKSQFWVSEGEGDMKRENGNSE
ncbi:hypothetical protein CPC08DRAFT_730595 [Agrocybe pediades]|nr:hypothetical protein CPC08DRAFT_730595 [Agrocybe pediades]